MQANPTAFRDSRACARRTGWGRTDRGRTGPQPDPKSPRGANGALPLRRLTGFALALVLSVSALGGALGPVRAAGDASASAPGASGVSSANKGPVTDLPLPRYVSLKASRVNLRVGPGRDYRVTWRYLKQGLPVEIIQEYDRWRRVRDSEGAEGWVYHSLLSGERTSIAAPWLSGKATQIDVHTRPAGDAPLVARLQPGVISSAEKCEAGWCAISVENRDGFIRQSEIWGVYPGERF